jgi:hypothetical protein
MYRRKKPGKAPADGYQLAYGMLGTLGLYGLLSFWGLMALLAGMLLCIGVIFYGALRAAKQADGFLWVGTAYSALFTIVDLSYAVGMFFGAWKDLHWHWIAAALFAVSAFAVQQWLTRPKRDANSLSDSLS